jgi:hypothetical protein
MLATPLALTRRRRNVSTPLVLGLSALVLWIVAVKQANINAMTPDGLVSILGWPYFAGLALIVAALALEIMRRGSRPRNLILLTLVFALYIYGTACAIEPVAGLNAGFVHAGFILYILQHGHSLNDYDGRFSWPGFFSLGAVLVSFAGLHNAVAFLRWFPLLIELSYMAPLIVIARCSGVGKRAAWLGIVFYYASNWIYQDYFSPQALNILFYLVIIAAVFACWEPATLRYPAVRNIIVRFFASIRGLFTRSRWVGLDASTEWPHSHVFAVMLMLSLISLASALSHQLTPYALLLALMALLLTRQLGRPELIVVVFLCAVGWLSLGASNYWIGHLNVIFGGIGQLSGTVGANVTSRVVGSAIHKFIVDGRILEVMALYSLGAIGALRRRPHSRALEALAGGPLILPFVQSYGGEGLLRAVLFGLPFISLLAASAILPNRVGPIPAIVPWLPFRRAGRKTLALLVASAVLILALATVLVRGGNDSYESWTTGEFAAVNYMYDHITPGQTLGLANSYVPEGFRDVDLIHIFIPDSNKRSLWPVSFAKNEATWIILSKSEWSWGVNVAGYPANWESNLERSLLNEGYAVAKTWPSATVLRASKTALVGH